MPTFKQKNVIKSYKLRLQEKLKSVTEETQNATSFLNNCVEEFKDRVQHILEIKDEKCLSLYRKLIKDLENYSEKLFILQASLEEVTEEESNSSEDEEAAAKLTKTKVPNLSSQSENLAQILPCLEGNVNRQRYLEGNVNLQRHPEQNVNQQKSLEDVQYNCQDEDGGSITEDDFYSLHSDNNVQNTDNCTLSSQLHGCHREFICGNEYASNISVSQNSCYRSTSSNISESLTFLKESKITQSIDTFSIDAKNKCSLESSNTTSGISVIDFDIESHFSATLSCIINAGNFWIQIENSHGSKLSFPKSEYVRLNSLLAIKKGSYCLAPFKLTSFYYRAQALSDAKSGEFVDVLFIDHGSTQELPLYELRPLPVSAYEIKAQAINCCLHGIAPTKDSWSNECTERFKEFQNFCIETIVKSKGNLYGVQLIAKLSADLKEDFSVDIAQVLCSDGLAISLNDSSHKMSHNQHCEFQVLKSVGIKTDSSLEVSGSYDINAISSDSGVSVTSAYKSSQISNKRNEIFHKVSGNSISSSTKNTVLPCDKNLMGFNHDTQIKDLISFESYDGLDAVQNSNEDLKSAVDSLSSCCPSCRDKTFCLHFKIPSPSLMFVEKDMVIVMLSHIVNPHEFYGNMAMENIVTLDDLREQMTCMYESENNLPKIRISDLKENMFCAGRFDADGYWYRIKIIRISPEDMEKNQVLGQYIDYGNTAVIQCCDLRPLTSEFSKHPSFAVKFSLAGTTPIKDVSHNPYWDEISISVFKKLASSERCLTAQICNELHNDENDSYPVLLWDTEDSNDLLINSSLADYKVAVFDYSLLHSALSNQNVGKPHSDIDSWNPMLEEYYDTENSYAVDDEDIEMVTTGYQAKDEEYICKYFSLRGHCPRGSNCRYKHLPLLESGVTHDQEEVYCLDTVPIISETVNNMLVQVSAIITPTHFYVVLPFGCKTVDDIDNLVHKESSYNEIFNSEAKALFYAINKYYSHTPFNENTSIALSCGTIVAAKRKWDEKWHRGRIIDVIGINKPAKVFFVDSGDHEWVSRKFIRTILPRFLHTPFQAVQCSLHGIEPIGFEKGSSWNSEALNFFKDVVAGEILLAEIVHRFGQIFHVSLRKTSQNDHENVAKHLVSNGFAQYHKIIHSDKKETIYVPG